MDSERLSSIPMLAPLSDSDRARVAAAVAERALPMGAVLTEQSDLSSHAFFIESGYAAVSRSDGLVAVLGPGDLVGEIGAETLARRSANVVAITPMTVLALMAWDLRDLSAQIPELGAAIEATIAARTAELDA